MNSLTPIKRRRNKYNAIRTIVGEHVFDSKREADAWIYLKHRENAGEIKDLKRQVSFGLHAHSESGPVKACRYIADFQYWDVAKQQMIVADAKGVKTALFKLKAKLLKANYGIEVELM